MMARRKVIRTSLELAKSFFSTRSFSTRLLSSQVIQFSHPTPSPSIRARVFHPVNTSQSMFFYSKPDPILELILNNDWSDELESELLKCNSALTHESVIYLLKKLDKEPEKALDFFSWLCEKKGFKPSSPVYSILLRIFVQNESMKNFWVNIRKMKEQGLYIDEETYLTIIGILKNAKKAADATALTHFHSRMLQENALDNVVQKVVSVVLRSNWSSAIENELGEMKIVLSDNFVIRVLKELRISPSKAFSFFRWVGVDSNYAHSTITYNAIARVLGQEESIEEFWSLIEEMKSVGYEIDIDTYIKISRQFQKNKMMGDAVKLYELMMDGQYKPSVQDCSMLLRSIAGSKNTDLSLVFRVAEKYESIAHTLPKAVYDGIHRSLTGVGQFDEAERILNVMRNAGHEPDNITYSQLVFGLCKVGRLDEACKLMDEMEANGCFPDIKTWTILIQGHCAANEVDKALLCFAKMLEKNIDPDADLFEVLINGFLKQKRLEGAYQLLVELVDKVRLRPWQATYKLLIENLLREMKLEEALNVLALMKKQNYPPYPEPFIQYISKFGTVEDAGEFLKALSVKEYPSISAYVHVFKAFFKEGRYSEAKDLLFKCPHHVRKHVEMSKLFGSAEVSPTVAAGST